MDDGLSEDDKGPGWSWRGVWAPAGLVHHHVTLPTGVVLHVAEFDPPGGRDTEVPLVLLQSFTECS